MSGDIADGRIIRPTVWPAFGFTPSTGGATHAGICASRFATTGDTDQVAGTFDVGARIGDSTTAVLLGNRTIRCMADRGISSPAVRSIYWLAPFTIGSTTTGIGALRQADAWAVGPPVIGVAIIVCNINTHEIIGANETCYATTDLWTRPFESNIDASTSSGTPIVIGIAIRSADWIVIRIAHTV